MATKILILGGTQFVGRHLSEYLSQQPDLEVTLFHRGRTNPELFPDLQHILGDRNSSDIAQIYSQDWDVVVDFSCYYPRPLLGLVQALSGHVGRYIFVSTVSVYDLEAFSSETLISESSPTVVCSKAEEIDAEMVTYGKRKVACEQVLLQHTELNPVVFRPGLIYGPYDPTDRAYYWLWRTQKAPSFLLAEPQYRHQWTYAVDFARILASAILGPQPKHDVYLALTHDALNFNAILDVMAEVCGTRPQRTVVDAQWMDSHHLNFWQDLPLSLPFERLFDRSRLLHEFSEIAGSFHQSWTESHAYYAALGWPEPQTGITQAQEAILLQGV